MLAFYQCLPSDCICKVNDVTKSYNNANATRYEEVMASYVELLQELYQYGARNFVIHNVIPVDLATRGTALKEEERTRLKVRSYAEK